MKNRIYPLSKRELKIGDVVLMIHCRTGQPFHGVIEAKYIGWDVYGSKELRYHVMIVENKRYAKHEDFELVATL